MNDLEKAIDLLSRAKGEIYLASHGNPELVAEIDAFLAEARRNATQQHDPRPPSTPKGQPEWA